MPDRDVDEVATAAPFGLAGGGTAVVGAAFAAAAMFPPDQQDARMLAMAITAGILAAVIRDWRACLGVTVITALLFVGFLAHRDGVLTGNPSAWEYAIAIGLAAAFGRGVRRISRARRHLPTDLAQR